MTTPVPPVTVPATPAKRRRRWPWYVGGAVVFLAVIGSCTGNAGTPTTYNPGPLSITPITPTTTTTPPSGPVTSIGDGTFEIGTGAGQVPAGTYHTTGPDSSNSMGCYFEREKDTSGNMDSIITNDITKGPTTVTISSTDGAFKTQGCSAWTKTR